MNDWVLSLAAQQDTSEEVLWKYYGIIMEVFLIPLSYSPRDIIASIHTNLAYCFSTFSTVK